jgi:hypothetical protein
MWPRLEYNLPIFGMDVVIAPSGKIQYVIADTTPVNSACTLPPIYVDAVRTLRAQFTEGFSTRTVPEWGAKTFSDEVVAARPDGPLESDMFVMYAVALARAHLLYAKRCPVTTDAEVLSEIESAHRRCGSLSTFKSPRSSLSKLLHVVDYWSPWSHVHSPCCPVCMGDAWGRMPPRR